MNILQLVIQSNGDATNLLMVVEVNQRVTQNVSLNHGNVHDLRVGEICVESNLGLDKHYDVIKSMMLTKYNLALLAKEIGKMLNVKIQQQAVEVALVDINACKNMAKGDVNWIKIFASINIFSMVAYPVAYHFYVFQSGQHSLENKIGFQYIIDVNKGSIGHSGGGATKFLFALLDWRNSNVTSTRCLQYNLMGNLLKVTKS